MAYGTRLKIANWHINNTSNKDLIFKVYRTSKSNVSGGRVIDVDQVVLTATINTNEYEKYHQLQLYDGQYVYYDIDEITYNEWLDNSDPRLCSNAIRYSRNGFLENNNGGNPNIEYESSMEDGFWKIKEASKEYTKQFYYFVRAFLDGEDESYIGDSSGRLIQAFVPDSFKYVDLKTKVSKKDNDGNYQEVGIYNRDDIKNGMEITSWNTGINWSPEILEDSNFDFSRDFRTNITISRNSRTDYIFIAIPNLITSSTLKDEYCKINYTNHEVYKLEVVDEDNNAYNTPASNVTIYPSTKSINIGLIRATIHMQNGCDIECNFESNDYRTTYESLEEAVTIYDFDTYKRLCFPNGTRDALNDGKYIYKFLINSYNGTKDYAPCHPDCLAIEVESFIVSESMMQDGFIESIKIEVFAIDEDCNTKLIYTYNYESDEYDIITSTINDEPVELTLDNYIANN